MKVGFIGLGRMGSAIAGNVLKGRHDLVVYNRSAEKAAPFADQGASVAGSIAEACAGRDVVITMLAHDAALEADALGPDGIVASLPTGAIHMPMGTHGVHIMRTLDAAHGEAGQILVAAPVLGRPDVAAAAQIGIVPAGPVDAVARCQPLFEVMGRRTFDAGTNPESAASINRTCAVTFSISSRSTPHAIRITRCSNNRCIIGAGLSSDFSSSAINHGVMCSLRAMDLSFPPGTFRPTDNHAWCDSPHRPSSRNC